MWLPMEKAMVAAAQPVGQITERALRQAGFRPVVVFRSVNVQLVYRIICTGAGVGLIPWYAAVPNREVVYFRLENPVYMIGGVVFRKDHALTQAERYFIYLRIKRYDKRMENTLKNFCWTEELMDIVREFEPDYVFEQEGEEG